MKVAYRAAKADDFKPRDESELEPKTRAAFERLLDIAKRVKGYAAPKAWYWAPPGSPGGAAYTVLEGRSLHASPSIQIFVVGEDRELLSCLVGRGDDIFRSCT